MKQLILCFLLITGFPGFILAQRPTTFYNFPADIATDIKKDTTAWKYQTAAVNYSFIGDHKNTLISWDTAVQSRKYKPTAADSALLKNASLKNARDYIIERSKKEQVIIINEAHHNPMHRRFTSSLLKGLYQNGYRYLGLEAIEDSLINERNYAVKESGYYTNEPEFGNMIYEARRLGFIVFGYEAPEGKNGKEREIAQAQNIKQYMQAHPEGKVIIHCGFDHIFEGEVRNWEKAMAGRLKEYTGIDPFTIDQVKFSERSSPELSHYFVNATNKKEAFVLIDAQHQAFRGSTTPPQTDLVIIHPRTRYKWDRPHWRALGRKTYWLPKKRLTGLSFPLMVMAMRTDELENGVPADIIYLESPEHKKPLYLTPGKYTLLMRNDAHEFRSRADITVR